MTPDEAIETLRSWLPPMGCTSLPEDPIRPREANALHSATNTLSSLARDHAALLDWAARAAEMVRDYNDWADEDCGEEACPDCKRPRAERALLVEWAEMQERPS